MIRLRHADNLTSAEQYGLGILLDLSRLVQVEDATADCVQLDIVDGPEVALGDWRKSEWGYERQDGAVRIARGALGLAAEVAGALAEHRTSVRDRLGRIPSSENVLAAAALERRPLVSEAALALRSATVAAAGRRPLRLTAPWPAGHRWAAAVTHDLDVVRLWPLFTVLRVAELTRKREGMRVAQVLRAAARAAARQDPVWQGVIAVLSAEGRHNIASTWFVLCGTPTPATMRAGDLTYAPESRAARRITARVLERRAEIGLHGSRETVERDGSFVDQRTRLEALTGRSVTGVRQHFLRMEPGRTHRAMQAAGFRYDSTAGFADRTGFRLGVADVIPVWDAAGGGAGTLVEIPFCWMDRALSKYGGIEDPKAWVDDALGLARACREVEGAWVGVWHPNLTPALGYPGATEGYAALLAGLAAEQPWFATLDEVVRWRASRASVRVRRWAGDRRAEYAVSTGLANDLVIEDAYAHPVGLVHAAQ